MAVSDLLAEAGLRPYTAADRPAAHAVLRRLKRERPDRYMVHPGDWDWWAFHADPRQSPAQRWIGEASLVTITGTAAGTGLRNDRELSAFGLDGEVLAALLPQVASMDWVAETDTETQGLLRAAGFTAGPADPVFERATRGGVPDVGVAPGVAVRRLEAGDPEEVRSRADAARLSFASTLDPQMHRDRYQRFTESPGYAWARDTVAVVGGTVTSFAVTWPDAELGLAQFEPVGTHPDWQRRGLGLAVMAAALEDLAASGIERARVFTDADRSPALGLYRRAGFEPVGALRWWSRR